ncbi:hypothetical protein ACH79_31360 [Bradyrhizobium sp. CCBAU 051011]|nr:hypothetical protein ACH79_31360 [Bradyrhizobium sp. CCBAU 051011]
MTKPFFVFGAEVRKRPAAIQIGNETAAASGHRQPETVQMRNLSFILAFAFVLAGPSMAGSSDQALPGVGTFAYSGSPVATTADQQMVLAAK